MSNISFLYLKDQKILLFSEDHDKTGKKQPSNVCHTQTLNCPPPLSAVQGPVPQKMVKLNPGLGQILSKVFLCKSM